MISVDAKRCTQCGVCIRRFQEYCISEKDGLPVFDHSVCNLCRKCAAVCPSQAILVNAEKPIKLPREPGVQPEDLVELYKSRRSIKIFKDSPVPRPLLAKIAAAGKYAPNQNKNIDVLVIDDPALISLIDREALRFFRRIHKIVFGFPPFTAFISLFSKELPLIRRKLEYDAVFRGQIIKKNTQAFIVVTGPKKVPVTDASAPYLLDAMMWYAHASDIGTCLMDSVKIILNISSKLKKAFGIKSDVLGALALGYSAENIVNDPAGYELNIKWNDGTAE